MARRVDRVEQGIQRTIVAFCDLDLAAGWFYFHVPNGEDRPKISAAILVGLGLKSGVADLIFISPGAVTHAMEIKRPGGKLTKPQIWFRDYCQGAGVPWAMVESLKQAIETLRGWGALRRPASVAA